MATTTQPRPGHMDYETTSRPSNKLWAVPIGRFFYSLIFIMSGLNHFSSGSIGYAASQGVPMASVLVPISGVIIMVGGLSVLLGFHGRYGAGLLLLFLLPTTLIMHDFWTMTDPAEAQNQFSHFMKNLGLIGGALLLAFYGSGPMSMDHRRSRQHIRKAY